jgi:transposase InsO family protein
VVGAKFDDLSVDNCRTCSLANIRRKRFKKRRTTLASKVLFRIFVDICGPFIYSYGQFLYFMLLIDDFSRYTFIYFLKHRSDALNYFKEYKAAVEKYLGEVIVVLRIDNAPEFIEGEFRDFCLKEGIQFEKIVPDASQQNGVVERGNQTVENSMRAMLLDAGLPLYFWPLAAQAAVHIGNRLPHSALPRSTTPFKRWFGVKPNISHFRPFGALVTARKSNSTDQNKVLMRGEEGRFVGYARDSTGWLVYFPESRTVRSRRDVDFHGFPTPLPAPPITPIELWKDIPLELESRFRDPAPVGQSNTKIWFDMDAPKSIPLDDVPSTYQKPDGESSSV